MAARKAPGGAAFPPGGRQQGEAVPPAPGIVCDPFVIIDQWRTSSSSLNEDGGQSTSPLGRQRASCDPFTDRPADLRSS